LFGEKINRAWLDLCGGICLIFGWLFGRNDGISGVFGFGVDLSAIYWKVERQSGALLLSDFSAKFVENSRKKYSSISSPLKKHYSFQNGGQFCNRK
jgi:hypothetical protein